MRYTRQNKILELIKSYEIETQGELVKKLQDSGIKATQATVSRDIFELGLVKAPGKSGKSCYRLADAPASPDTDKFRTILRETVQSIRPAENLIIIRTLSGCANAAAEAIDASAHPEIVGTIAGDNTIFVAIDKKENVPAIISEFTKLME